MNYCSSPHSITGKTPAPMMFNREITRRLSLLLPAKAAPNEADKGGNRIKYVLLKLMILYGLEYIQGSKCGVLE